MIMMTGREASKEAGVGDRSCSVRLLVLAYVMTREGGVCVCVLLALLLLLLIK